MQPFDAILFNDKNNEVLIHAMSQMNSETMPSEKSQLPEDHILYDSTYTTFPEKANPRRQKADQWLYQDWVGRKVRGWCTGLEGNEND